MKKTGKRFLALLTAGASAGIILAGCGGGNAGSGSAETTSSDTASASEAATAATTAGASKGDKHINVGYYWLTPNLDYSEDYTGWEVSIMGIGEALVKLNQKLEVEPCLADSWEVKDDTTWEFHIRDGVKFSNGKPVDAAACKAAIERSLELNARAKGYLDVASIEAEGQKLTIKTNKPNGALLNNISEPLFDIIDVSEGDEVLKTRPSGTGPFIVTDFVPETSIELVKNENYWDGEVGLDSVSVTYIADESARVMALQSGEVDLSNYIDYQSIPTFEGKSEYNVSSVTGPRVNVVYMNNAESSPLNDKNLRVALSYAPDRDAYAGMIGGTAAHGVFSDGTPYGNDKLKGYSYDPEKAKQLLDEAGYKDTDGDGYVEGLDGKPMTLQFYQSASTGDAATLAVALQSNLKDIGVNMNINTIENMADVREKGEFDMYTTALNSAPTGDPQVWLETMYTLGSDDLQTSSTSNATKYRSDAMDSVVDRLKTTFDTKERYSLAQEGSQVLLDDAADLYLTNNMLTMISSSKLENCIQPVCDFYMLTKDMKIK